MAARRGRTRERMLHSAVALLRERSAAGVSIDAVLAHSGAPRGSVYHHFPGGRDEMIVEAVRLAGDHVAGLIERTDAEDPCAVIRRLADFWRGVLADGQHRAGCPVVALAVDQRGDDPAAEQVVREVFALWQQRLAEVFTASGMDVARAGRLALLVIAAAEGAVVLCRAQRDAQPLDDICVELCALVERRTPSPQPVQHP